MAYLLNIKKQYYGRYLMIQVKLHLHLHYGIDNRDKYQYMDIKPA